MAEGSASSGTWGSQCPSLGKCLHIPEVTWFTLQSSHLGHSTKCVQQASVGPHVRSHVLWVFIRWDLLSYGAHSSTCSVMPFHSEGLWIASSWAHPSKRWAGEKHKEKAGCLRYCFLKVMWENSYLLLKEQLVEWTLGKFMQAHPLILEPFVTKGIQSSSSSAVINKLTSLP